MNNYRWVVDKEHTQIRFHNRHMTIVMVSGGFTEFDINIEGRDFSNIVVTIPVSGLNTEHIQRDEHLKSPDFLDAQNHPFITFVSKSFRPVDEEKWVLEGTLNIRGIAKDVVIDVEYGGEITDWDGVLRSGFSLETKINRNDFGLGWNVEIEAGYIVENEVRITADVELMWLAGEPEQA